MCKTQRSNIKTECSHAPKGWNDLMKKISAVLSALLAALMLASPLSQLGGRQETAIVAEEPAAVAPASYSPEPAEAVTTAPKAEALPETVISAPEAAEEDEPEAPAKAEEPAETQAQEEPSPAAAVPSEEDAAYARRAEEIKAAKEAEQEFLARNPEIAALGEVIPEGSSLPAAENDPGFHKYVAQLMNVKGTPASVTGLALPLMTSAVAFGSQLTHQDRFKNYLLTHGTDVSVFQGTIDWKKVKAAGMDFCILRAGYRGYGKEGTLVVDPTFVYNLKNAKAAGLKVGVYFFTQALNVTEARAEADFVYQYIKNYSLDLPVYCDMEEIWADTGRLDSANLTAAQKTSIIEAFCDRITSLGYQGGVYSNWSWLVYKLNRLRLEAKYPIWFANYTNNTQYPYKFDIWQYDTGTVDGINGLTDMDVRYIMNTNPEQITGLKVTARTEDSITIEWSKTKQYCSGYRIERYDEEKGQFVYMMLTLANKRTITGLEQGKTYTYRVRAYNYYNNVPYLGVPSSSVTSACMNNTPVVTNTVTSGGITLTWDADPLRTGCTVYIGRYGTEPAKIVSTSKNTYTYKCSPGVYDIRVEPYTTVSKVTYRGRSTDIFTVYCNCDECIPKLVSTANASAAFAWDAPAKGVSKVIIHSLDEQTGEVKDLAEAAGADLSAVVSGLELSKQYILYPEIVYESGDAIIREPIVAVARNGLAGDVNNDGIFDLKDYGLLKKYLLGRIKIDLSNADVDLDEDVDADDAALMKEIISGLSIELI